MLETTRFRDDPAPGRAFADWLGGRLALLGRDGFDVSEPVPDEGGHAVCVLRGRARWWITLTPLGAPPEDGPAPWSVAVVAEPVRGWRRWFQRPDAEGHARLRGLVERCLRQADDLRLLDAP